jgi:hypothetical protein
MLNRTNEAIEIAKNGIKKDVQSVICLFIAINRYFLCVGWYLYGTILVKIRNYSEALNTMTFALNKSPVCKKNKL